MPTVILDTDFLSSFLKINRCDLIQALYEIEQALMPRAVLRELARTDLLVSLLAIRWVNVSTVELLPDETLLHDSSFQNLGAGEQECIRLAQTLPDVVLLMNDNKARRFAHSLGIAAVNIPAFLLACKMAGLVSPVQMRQIILDLKTEDFYEFKSEVRDLLLE